MKDVMNLAVKNPIFVLFCFFIPFDNTSLQNIGGIMTASPSSLLLIPGLAVSSLKYGLKIRKEILIFVLLTMSVSTLYFFYWSNLFDSLSSLFVLDRGSRYIALFGYYFLSYLYCSLHPYSDLVAASKVIILVILLSIILNYADPNLINHQGLLQFNDFISPDRLRGFALEASVFGFQIVCMVLLIAMIYNLKLHWVLLLTITLAILTTSKGAALSFLICMCLYFSANGNVIFRIVLTIFCVTASYIMFKMFFLVALATDIDNYSSVATRTTMFITGLKILLYNPLGVGYFGYIPAIYDFTPGVIMWMKKIIPYLNYDEVATYTRLGEYKAIGTKSLFIDCVIMYGFIFLVPFFTITRKVLLIFSKNKDKYAYMLTLYVIIANLFFISHIGDYITSFCIAVALARYSNHVSVEKSENQTVGVTSRVF
ncbi:hypothetical protein [Pantoea phytobeneficialis]|uniref:Uncharacterized protein n=1 Tax=Pantoea phytobeneficialis TaxID=2052056 RepID=A0ABT8XWY4_9GAMM|nr:hypothetical protein [Pantoea phytobeneficialis]MDO6407404.1 hypothetical protein [Pantoea phytobeneficialis]